MRITAIWCCFCVLFWITAGFLKTCPLSQDNHCAVTLWGISEGVWVVGFPPQNFWVGPTLSEFSLGAGFGFPEVLKCGSHPAPPCLAGYSSFNIDRQIFPTSHGVNVMEVSRCQYDILQKPNKNKTQFNNRKCQNVMTLYWFPENTQSALKVRSHLGQLDLILR